LNQIIEEVAHHIYRIIIPLPRSPLKFLNSYLIRGDRRFLLVDTGMNRNECLSVMTSSLKKLGVNLESTDFFITHLHADHLGLAGILATGLSKVYFNEIEARMKSTTQEETKLRRERIFRNFLSHGFPSDELRESEAKHPGRRYGGNTSINYFIVRDNDQIEIGDYCFRCIQTPGHSPGHCCLYEANEKIFISGDHILFDITPNITYWEELDNSLKHYLTNLEKIYDLDVRLVLPGHRNLMNNHRRRIKELEDHHTNRLNEVIFALEDDAKTAFQIAPYITWDIVHRSWEQFPLQQKWFAFGETLAHLNYLEAEGRVQSKKKNGKLIFSLI